jgi:hypothetical protein
MQRQQFYQVDTRSLREIDLSHGFVTERTVSPEVRLIRATVPALGKTGLHDLVPIASGLRAAMFALCRDESSDRGDLPLQVLVEGGEADHGIHAACQAIRSHAQLHLLLHLLLLARDMRSVECDPEPQLPDAPVVFPSDLRDEIAPWLLTVRRRQRPALCPDHYQPTCAPTPTQRAAPLAPRRSGGRPRG